MTLKVIGAGLGRTGTLTLKTALERLGYGPCNHMTEVLADMERQGPFWNRAADGLVNDWEEGLGAYRSTVDWPSAAFYAELADFYPDAKVVLSLRDPEQWYESMFDTILKSMGDMGMTGEIDSDHPMRFGKTLIFERTFGGDLSKDNVIAAFERHNEEVRRRIAPERLLVFQASGGWEPLCAHLGVAVPDDPFPRVNDREEFQSHAQRARELNER
jgi:hypothetical protein